MTTINDAYINALLADATYALDENTPDGITGEALAQLDAFKVRMTPAVASYIGDNFEVVTHFESDDTYGSGFDATVWRRKSDNQIFVSMQGTRGLQDFITDFDLTTSGAARNQIIDMVNWWLRITTPTGQMVNQFTEISVLNQTLTLATTQVEGLGVFTSPPTDVIVNGHSLGGHLATAFARLFGGTSGLNIQSINTFNSAGFTVASEFFFDEVASHLDSGVSADNFLNDKQNNFFADNGLSVTTRDFLNIHYGQRIRLFNESSGDASIANHSMYKLTDTLSLGSMLFTLDNSLTLEQLYFILDSISSQNTNDDTIECVFNSVSKLFLGDFFTSTTAGDVSSSASSRVEYYNNLFSLITSNDFQQLQNNITIGVFGSTTNGNVSVVDANYLTELASTNIAYRYALTEGIPFVMIGNGLDYYYEQQNQHGELELDVTYDNYGNLIGHQLTEQYLEDRAAYLVAKMTQGTGGDEPIGTYYKDLGANTEIHGADVDTAIIFGKLSEENIIIGNELGVNNISDRIYGGTKNDQIWGLAGSDTLIGGLGDDTLLGGEGTDTYVWNAGDGNDVIYDDKAKLILNGEVVTGLTRVGGFVSYDLTTYPAGVDIFSWSTTVDGQAQTYLFYFFRQADTTDKFIVKIYTQDQVVDLTNPEESTSATEVLTLFEFDPVASGLFTEVQMNGFSTIGSNAGMAVQDSLISDAHTDDFFGGSVVDQQHYTANTLLSGSIGDDHLYGMPVSELYGDFRPSYVLETIDPNNPAETYNILGQALDGNDTLNGGAGNDILLGGYGGNDTFEFDAGFGWDIIADMNHSLMMRSGDADTVIFKNQSADDFSFWCGGQTQTRLIYGREQSHV